MSFEYVRDNSEKIKAGEKWPMLQNVGEPWNFLGVTAYYRRFVLSFTATVSRPTEITKRKVVSSTPECKQPFETLEENLYNLPLLALPDFPDSTGCFILDTNVSDSAIRAVLS